MRGHSSLRRAARACNAWLGAVERDRFADLHASRAHGRILRKRDFSGEVGPSGGRLTDLSGLGPARFYKVVDVQADDAGSVFTVMLDGRSVKTPRRSALATPVESLAIALAAEWDAQEDRIRPSSMPLTTLVSTSIDIVPEFRSRIESSITKYLDTDAVCIRPGQPANLVEEQERLFRPIQTHLANTRNIDLTVTVGGLSAIQPPSVRCKIQEFINTRSDLALAALDSATATAKSIAIAMALHDGAIDSASAAAAARSEEAWQEGVWGTVEGGHDLDAADVLVRLSAAEVIFGTVAANEEKFARTSVPLVQNPT